MNKLLQEVFKSINMQYFYVNKGEKTTQDKYVVFNYYSIPFTYSDNEKEGDKYTILLNVYCKKEIDKINREVVKAMNIHGIKGGKIQNPYLEENGYYNTAIEFEHFLREE